MNREFLHKITLLGCLLLLITSSVGSDKGFQTPEQYAQIVQDPLAELSQCILDSSNGSIINVI